MPTDTRTDIIKIGTRGSPLALAQAHMVRDGLLASHPGLTGDQVEIVTMSTKGDRILDRPLADLGGKGLFTEEIEAGLLNGSLHMAVHSMKDLETVLPDGLHLACMLEREDVRDAFLSPKAASISGLPAGSLVGTASLRRQAQIRRMRPDLRVDIFRGNVQTRLKKLRDGVADATLLAMAGLRRLGLEREATQIIETDQMLPAVSQGAIGIETRIDDEATNALLAPLAHAETMTCVTAERAMLAMLDGSCRTPIAGLARIKDGQLTLRGEVLRPDGSEAFTTERTGLPSDAAAMGADAGEELKRRAGPGFFDG